MTSSNKDTAVKFEPRFLGLVKTGSYDALKYENSYDQNIKMSRGRDIGKKKKTLRLRELPEIVQMLKMQRMKCWKLMQN